ncbi:MAG: peptidoglycan-binding protein [Candidatus Latescibacteria bacterium]|nr:peptidoglycan-binding protein [Candidatus Latescibacterota bacterium]
MNRYENPPEPVLPKPSFALRFLAPFAPVVVVIAGSALLGRLTGVDWMDRPIRALVHLHIAGLGMDLYTLGIARRCRRREGPVRIPYAAPILFAILRLLLHGACRAKLAQAGWLYAVSSEGMLLPRTGPLLLIGLFALLSLALAVYEAAMIRMALCPPPEKLRRAEAPPADMPVGPEYTYEVQSILHNMGYYAGPVDGVLSQEVKTAVKRFQGEAGLMAHGGLTAATIIELRKAWEVYQVKALQHPSEGRQGRNGRGVWTRIQDWLR